MTSDYEITETEFMRLTRCKKIHSVFGWVGDGSDGGVDTEAVVYISDSPFITVIDDKIGTNYLNHGTNKLGVGSNLSNVGGSSYLALGNGINMDNDSGSIMIGHNTTSVSNGNFRVATGNSGTEVHIDSIWNNGCNIMGGQVGIRPLRVGALEINRGILVDKTGGGNIKILAMNDSDSRIGFVDMYDPPPTPNVYTTTSEFLDITGLDIDTQKMFYASGKLGFGSGLVNNGGIGSLTFGNDISVANRNGNVLIGHSLTSIASSLFQVSTGTSGNQIHISGVWDSHMDLMGGVTSVRPVRLGALELNKTLLVPKGNDTTGLKILAVDDTNNRVGYVPEDIFIGAYTLGSTDNAVVRWSGPSGNVVSNSLVTIDDSGDIYTPTEIAVGASVLNTESLHLDTPSSAWIWVEADNDNVTESDLPNLVMTTDGGSTNCSIGIDSAANIGYIATTSSVGGGFRLYTGGNPSSASVPPLKDTWSVAPNISIDVSPSGIVQIPNQLVMGASGIAFDNTSTTTSRLSYYSRAVWTTETRPLSGSNSNTGNRNIECIRIGSQVTLTFKSNSTHFFDGTQTGTTAYIFTATALAAAFRPTTNIYILALGGDSVTPNKTVMAFLSTAGILQIYSGSDFGSFAAGNVNIRNFSISYVV